MKLVAGTWAVTPDDRVSGRSILIGMLTPPVLVVGLLWVLGGQR